MDGGTLVVGLAGDRYLDAYRIDKDGGLSAGEKYYPLRTRAKTEPSEVAALALDGKSRLYAATKEGVQVFDPTGRLCGVLLSPRRAPITGLALAGEMGDELYVVCAGKLWMRSSMSS